jgi:plastocyanin
MNRNRVTIFLIARLFFLTAAFLAMASIVHATTHIIRFGDTLGYSYSPKTLNVAIGDIVRWEGDFSSHPLSSTSVPPGALTFHQDSGTVFSYLVEVEGTYNYRCDFHYLDGMTGSFVSTTTGVEEGQNVQIPDTYRLEKNYPNPFNPNTIIGFQLPVKEHVELRIYNRLGQEVRTLVNEQYTMGSHNVVWDGRDDRGRSVASGLYVYRLKAGGFVSTETMILVR